MSKLQFEKQHDKSGIYTVDGFGKEALCPWTGEKGENASRATYAFDQKEGRLSVSGFCRDMKNGNHRESVYPAPGDPKLPKMSKEQAEAFATVTDAALTGRIKGMNPAAESLADVPFQNSNALKGLLKDSVHSAKSAVFHPKDAMEDVSEFFNDVTETKDITYSDVKPTLAGGKPNPSIEAGMGHLENTICMRSKSDPSKFVYFKANKNAVQIWEPTNKNNLSEGSWLKFDDNMKGRYLALAVISDELGVGNEVAFTLNLRNVAQATGVSFASSTLSHAPSTAQNQMKSPGLSINI